MGKPTICIGENKDADQLRGDREADHAFVFAIRIAQFLFYLNPKFQASSSFLCLYRPFRVGPVRKPHCWFSHEAAQMNQWLSLQDEIDMELGVNSDETLPKEPIKKDSQDPKQNLQTLLQRQAKFLESCREVKV